jgi:hypothetical protein
MTEHDAFEARFHAAIHGYTGRVTSDLDAAALARRIAAAEPRRHGLVTTLRWTGGTVPRLAWLLLVAALLAALAGAALVGSRLLPKTQDTLTPTGIEVFPGGPRSYLRVVAISRDELWAISGQVVWHLLDGTWTSEEIDPSRIVGGSAGPGVGPTVTLAPDGTVWAAGVSGVAYRRDGRWVVVDPFPATVVTVDHEGTAWTASTLSSCAIWALRFNGSSWTRTSAECPFTFGGGAVTSMAVDGRGALWVGAQGFVHKALARYAEGRWDTTAPRAGLPDYGSVEILGTAATGDLWIRFQEDAGAKQTARYDGTTWTVMPAPDMPETVASVAPGAASWASTLAGYNWQMLEAENPSVVPPLTPLTVAPDGTVFAVDGEENLVRLAAASPPP